MLPVEHSSLQLGAGSRAKALPSASSGAKQPWERMQQPGTGAGEGGGGISRADVGAILLGVSNMDSSWEVPSFHVQSAWLLSAQSMPLRSATPHHGSTWVQIGYQVSTVTVPL